jgi:hypothetical protein
MYTTNCGKPIIYTVKSDLKGTSLQQIVETNHIYSQSCLKGYIYTTNRSKPTIHTVKPDLKGTSIKQIMVNNQPYIQSNLP